MFVFRGSFWKAGCSALYSHSLKKKVKENIFTNYNIHILTETVGLYTLQCNGLFEMFLI